MNSTSLYELLILTTSEAKDGDVLILKTDAQVPTEDLSSCMKAIGEATGKKLILLVLPTGTDISLIDAADAKAILDRIIASKEPQP